MNATDNLSMSQIELYIDRASYFQEEGDIELCEFFKTQALELTDQLDNGELLTLTYHRQLSDSFGVEFEITHGDPELKFGGI